MKRIPISGRKGIGLHLVVDDEDFDLLSKFKWFVTRNKQGTVEITGEKPSDDVTLSELKMAFTQDSEENV